jgi:hypothetical protein
MKMAKVQGVTEARNQPRKWRNYVAHAMETMIHTNAMVILSIAGTGLGVRRCDPRRTTRSDGPCCEWF